MLNTVFKDKVPKGVCYPFPLEFLKQALPAAAEQQVALYFAHGSHWRDHSHQPHALLTIGSTRPMLRNNNHKVTADLEGCDWHFLLLTASSELRHVLQMQFHEIAGPPLAQWFVGKPRSNHARVWWHPATQKITVDFPDAA
jgi:hypothetical protein